jgi:hypothetical protein
MLSVSSLNGNGFFLFVGFLSLPKSHEVLVVVYVVLISVLSNARICLPFVWTERNALQPYITRWIGIISIIAMPRKPQFMRAQRQLHPTLHA